MRRRAAQVVLLALLSVAAPIGAPADQGRHSRDEAFRMVDAYILGNLQDKLALTDEQLERVRPLVRRLQKDRRELAQRRFRALHELDRALRSGGATRGRVAELLQELKTLEAQQPAVLAADMAAIDAVLDPVQQAQYRILEVELERRIREVMARRRGLPPGRPGPPPHR